MDMKAGGLVDPDYTTSVLQELQDKQIIEYTMIKSFEGPRKMMLSW